MSASALLATFTISLGALAPAWADCPPATPTGLNVTQPYDCSRAVVISWSPVSGATGYEVWVNSIDEFATATLIGSPSASPISDVRPADGTYYYWVVATSECGSSTPSAAVAIELLMDAGPELIENFCGYPRIEPPPPEAYRIWYPVFNITWSDTSLQTVNGSAVLKYVDGGWSNGIYAIYEAVFPTTGVYQLQAKLHVVENDTTDGLQALQLGVQVPGAHPGSEKLPPCPVFGSYQGLTPGNDTAIGPQVVTTGEFWAEEGQNLLVAIGTDVTSGNWNLSSSAWGDTYVLIDDIRLEQSTNDNCSYVPPVNILGPLVVGASTVRVAGVSQSATRVRIYVNDMLWADVGVSDWCCETLSIPLPQRLAAGDRVWATQQGSDGPEGCVWQEEIVSGSGANATGLRLTLAVRETGTSGPVGSDGGVIGTLEWIGATTLTSCGSPWGKLIEPSPEWQTVTFAMGSEPVINCEGGNGVLDCPYARCVLEGLAFVPNTPEGGPYTVYIDNVMTWNLNIADFEGFPAGTEQVPISAVPADFQF